MTGRMRVRAGLLAETPWARLAPWLATAGRLLLAGVWAWAAMSKVADPDASVRAVRAYRILPEGLAQLVGWGLPFLELGLAVLLVAGLATRLAAVVSAALLMAFMVGIASAWARGLRIDCGCFGGGGDDPTAGAGTYLRELARDAGLALVAVVLAIRPWSRLALDNLIGAASTGPRPPEGLPRQRPPLPRPSAEPQPSDPRPSNPQPSPRRGDPPPPSSEDL